MLNFGNKEFRNLQEQVLKNMADIKDIHEGATVLGEFGIKVVGQVESSSDLPDPTEYEGEYGDAYVVGEEAPYDYYIFTRPFEDVDDPQWFNLGQFPAPGPQGETGETGATGATPVITASASTSTLSSGQDASVSITKTGTDEAPHFTFAFEIPQGVQGIQGVQGAQGIQGPQGPQGIQGQKGDTGYLYTIIGQVNNESSLPLPGQLPRTSAFLVGSQEPYDVYIIIGQDAYDLEWLNIGPIATVVPTTYVASATDAASGTLDATTLAAINNETGVHYMRVGSELYEFANTYNGNSYYMSLRYDSSTQVSKVARFTVALSSGAWTTGTDTITLGSYTVTTNTTQTITGTKTFSSTINVGPAFQIGVSGTSPSEYYSLLRTGAYSEGIFFHTDGIAVGAKLYPGSNNTYDLGSSTNKWKDLWLSGYLRDGTNSISVASIAAKQDALPTVVNDRYLHTNSSTGALEWSTVSASGGTQLYHHSIRFSIYNNQDWDDIETWIELYSTDANPYSVEGTGFGNVGAFFNWISERYFDGYYFYIVSVYLTSDYGYLTPWISETKIGGYEWVNNGIYDKTSYSDALSNTFDSFVDTVEAI